MEYSDLGYGVSLIGSASYTEENNDWACNNDFQPRLVEMKLPIEFNGLEWHEVLKKVIEDLRGIFLTELFKTSFLGDALSIGVGFSDGDLFILWPKEKFPHSLPFGN